MYKNNTAMSVVYLQTAPVHESLNHSVRRFHHHTTSVGYLYDRCKCSDGGARLTVTGNEAHAMAAYQRIVGSNNAIWYIPIEMTTKTSNGIHMRDSIYVLRLYDSILCVLFRRGGSYSPEMHARRVCQFRWIQPYMSSLFDRNSRRGVICHKGQQFGGREPSCMRPIQRSVECNHIRLYRISTSSESESEIQIEVNINLAHRFM